MRGLSTKLICLFFIFCCFVLPGSFVETGYAVDDVSQAHSSENPQGKMEEDEVLYFEDFDQSIDRWRPKNNNPNVIFEHTDGQLEIKHQTANKWSDWYWIGHIFPNNFIVEVDANLVSKTGKYGIVFKTMADNEMYLFLVDPVEKSYSMFHFTGTWATGAWNNRKFSKLINKEKNHIKLVKMENEVEFYIGENHLAKFSIGDLSETYLGLYIEDTDRQYPVDVLFDNFRVTKN